MNGNTNQGKIIKLILRPDWEEWFQVVPWSFLQQHQLHYLLVQNLIATLETMDKEHAVYLILLHNKEKIVYINFFIDVTI